jgi:hypothetical protein
MDEDPDSGSESFRFGDLPPIELIGRIPQKLHLLMQVPNQVGPSLSLARPTHLPVLGQHKLAS